MIWSDYIVIYLSVNRQIAILAGLLLTVLAVGKQATGVSNNYELTNTRLVGAINPSISGNTGQSMAELRSRAAQISSAIAADNTQANLEGLRYLADMSAVQTDKQRLSAASKQIESLSKKLQVMKKELYRVALSTYTDAGNTNSFMLLFSSNLTQEGTGSVYLKVAADRLNGEEHIYSGQQRQMKIVEAERELNLKLAAANLVKVDIARHQVITELADEKTLLSGVNGQLTHLVAVETAARERAQAAELQLQEKLLQEQLAAKARQAKKRSESKHNGVTIATATSSGSGNKSSGPTTTAPTTTAPASKGPAMSPTLAQDFAGIRNCESGDVYTLNTGNGYYGAYQFSASTWAGLGEGGLPNEAAPPVQDAAAYKLYQQSGWESWPACSASLGLP